MSQLENYLTKVQLVILLLGLDALKIAVLTKDLALIKYIYAEALSFKTSSLVQMLTNIFYFLVVIWVIFLHYRFYQPELYLW